MTQPGSRQDWIVPLSKAGAGASAPVRLICFPHAGGAAATYRSWAEAAPPEIEVMGVQLPGRGPRLRETPCGDIREASAAIVDALRHGPAAPFAFFGHSIGAILAYRVAEELCGAGGPFPQMLFLSAAEPPHLDWHGPRLDGLSRPDLERRLQELEGTPAAVLENEELVNLMLPALHADVTMARTYGFEPGTPLEVPIHVFGGSEDPFAERKRMQRWRELTRASFSLRTLPGGHFYLESCRDRLVSIIARELLGASFDAR